MNAQPWWTQLPPWCHQTMVTALELLWRTWDIHQHGAFPLDDADPRRIYTLWHGRMLALSPLLPIISAQQPLVALVMDHPQGRLLAHILEDFGVKVVWGSTWRRGPRALVELARAINNGASTLIAVDGPEGPAFCARSGAVGLAAMTQVPICPLGAEHHDGWIMAQSWDQHLIPKPCSNLHLHIGASLPPPARRDHTTHRQTLRALQRRLATLNHTSPVII